MISRRVGIFLFQAEDGIRDLVRSRGLGDVYKRQEQHYQNFSDRFAQVSHEWPVKIAEISRFKSAKEQLSLIHI